MLRLFGQHRDVPACDADYELSAIPNSQIISAFSDLEVSVFGIPHAFLAAF
jgi:hypothetical protein